MASLISVVVPIYNQEEFAVAAVQSILDQSYGSLEIIIIDDGSTDGSASLVEREFGERVQLIRQSNQGTSRALNRGLREAKGEYIAFLGGDDLCFRDRFERQIELMQSTSVDIAFSLPVLIDRTGRVMPDSSFPVFFNKSAYSSYFDYMFIEGNFLCASSALMKRRVMEVIGYFTDGLVQLQDYEYWLRALVRGFRIGVDDYRVVQYRRHENNLSSLNPGVASTAEMALIIQNILSMLEAAPYVRQAFSYCLPPTVDPKQPLTDLEKLLVELAHPHKGVRILGIQQLIQMINDHDCCSYLEASGLSPVRFLRESSSLTYSV
jgi:glycosyltransferase involved in cell wall biosynthesis